jgi:16S rRNA (uracil1498-N3)-methyltransferase
MSKPRFFLTDAMPDATDAVRLPLSDSDVHHAVSVLRLKPGDELEVVEPGGGRAFKVLLTHASVAGVEGLMTQELAGLESVRVALVQGVAKGEKMDDIVRQAVEIGACEIIPVITERSVVRLAPGKRADKGERWRRIAKSAAQQSHRDEIPPVHDPVPSQDALQEMERFNGVVVLWEEAGGQGVESAIERLGLGERASVALVVGPEGGLTRSEVERFSAMGAEVASLGPGILRTETAALVALTIALHHLGGLGRD